VLDQVSIVLMVIVKGGYTLGVDRTQVYRSGAFQRSTMGMT